MSGLAHEASDARCDARRSRKTRGEGDRGLEIHVEDIYGAIASVTARSTVEREYLHLARTEEGWKIVNALWAWA